jgi:hypothetical protein
MSESAHFVSVCGQFGAKRSDDVESLCNGSDERVGRGHIETGFEINSKHRSRTGGCRGDAMRGGSVSYFSASPAAPGQTLSREEMLTRFREARDEIHEKIQGLKGVSSL